MPNFGGQGYGGYVLFPRATDIRIVEGIVYIVYGNSLYQIDLRGGRVAQRFACKLGSADYKSFLVQCDGRLYVFTGPTADRTAWQGYSASLQSLRNVFIQN